METPDSSAKIRSRITSGQRRRSLSFIIAASVFWLIAAQCLSTNVMTLFALKLGATEIFIGVLNFVFFAALFCQIFALSAVERHGKKYVIFLWQLIAVIISSAFIFLPMLTNKFSPNTILVLILAITILRMTAQAFSNAGWFPLLQDVVPPRVTGRFFANLRTAWQTASLVTLLLLAWFLGTDAPWWKFQIVFIAAFLFFIGRLLTILPVSENVIDKKEVKKINIPQRFKLVWRQKNLRTMIFYLSSYMMAAMIAEPFKIKFLKDLGFSNGFIIAATAMISLGAIVSLRLWGKLADRFGNHSIFTITHFGLPMSMILWLFVGKNTAGVVLVPVLYFLWSVFNSGNAIAQTRYILHTVSPDKQYQINIINVIAFLSIGIAPLIAGFFLKITSGFSVNINIMQFNNYHLLFVISALLFITPHILRHKLRIDKDSSTMDVLVFVTKPLRNFFGPYIPVKRRNRKSRK